MSEKEKALIEAATVVHDINPGYASAFLDGVKAAVNAMKESAADDGAAEKEENEDG